MAFLGLTAGALSSAAGAGVTSGITSGISGLMSGAIGGLFSGIKNRKAHKRNKEILKLQNKYEVERMRLAQEMNREQAQFNQGLALQMFDYTSKYNSPAEQVKRLKEAGLNPALMYGGGGGGGAGQGSTAGAGAAGDVAALQPMGLQLGLQAEMQAAQIDALRAQTHKTNVEAGAIGANINKANTDVDNSKKKTHWDIKDIRERIRASKIDTKEKELKNEILDAIMDIEYEQTVEMKVGEDGETISVPMGGKASIKDKVVGLVKAALRNKRVELDAIYREEETREEIAYRLFNDIDKIVKGKLDELTLPSLNIEVLRERIKELKLANEKGDWELANQKALGKLIEAIGGDDEYSMLFKELLRWFFGTEMKMPKKSSPKVSLPQGGKGKKK